MIKVPKSHTLLQANSIDDCDLKGVICHKAPSCNLKLQQSVQSVGANSCHLATGTFLTKKILISNGTYEFCYFFVKQIKIQV